MSATSLFPKLAQAARPLAGGSPLLAVWQTAKFESQRLLAALCETNRTLARSPSSARLPVGRFSPRPSVFRVRPNPSVEWTSTGLARDATQVIVSPRGPSRFRPLTSNVRPHVNTSNVFFAFSAFADTAECKRRRLPRLAGQSSLNTSLFNSKPAASVMVRAGSISRQQRWHIKASVRLVSSWSRLAAAELRGSGLRSLVSSTKRSVLRDAKASAWRCQGVFAPGGASLGAEVRPNPSLEWTRSGKALGPRGVVVHHPPRGPSAFPARAPQLKR
jgi:hypothetical protein